MPTPPRDPSAGTDQHAHEKANAKTKYEIRRWRDGEIPDIAEAVDSPRRLTVEAARAQRVLDLVPQVPTPVWGRDELRTGAKWNSNSVIAWLLSRSGIDAGSILPPPGGRAPGWHAGLVVSGRGAALYVNHGSTVHPAAGV